MQWDENLCCCCEKAFIYFFLSQGVVNSVETGKKIACQDSAPRQAYLIGLATNIRPLQRDSQLKLAIALSVPVDLVSSSALFSKRCLLNDVGYDGTMCCSGDYVIIANNGQETVVKIETMLSVNCGSDLRRIVGMGYLYSFHRDAVGQIFFQLLDWFLQGWKKSSKRCHFFSGREHLEKSSVIWLWQWFDICIHGIISYVCLLCLCMLKRVICCLFRVKVPPMSGMVMYKM